MSVQIVEQTPLEHFEWLIRRYPRSATVEMMKCAFNRGLMTAIDKYHPHGDSRNWLFEQMLGLDTEAMDPPLTAADWERGP